MNIIPCKQIEEHIGELFTCSELNGYVRIRTPYLYPDGDVIDVFLSESTGSYTLTDLGETLGWLKTQTVAPKRSPKQRQLIFDVCLTHGVELFRGMLTVRVQSPDEVTQAVVRLSQAALRVADLWFTFRTRAVESITDEVADLLGERDIAFDRSEKLLGRSGRTWTVDFHTRHARKSNLVYVLSTGSRAAARGVAEHVLAAWYDLSHLKIGPQALNFVSLFDDTLDIWTHEDFNLVSDLSDVTFWSKPDEFIDKLAA
jgi:Domain of unknown function DUF1828